MARPKLANPKVSRSVRLSEVALEKGELVAKEGGYSNVSELMRSLLQKAIEEYERKLFRAA